MTGGLGGRSEQAGYRPVSRRDWRQSRLSLWAYAGLLVLGGRSLLPRGELGPVLWALLAGVGLTVLGRWYAAFAYACARCGSRFRVPLVPAVWARQGVDAQGAWKYLCCPACGEHGRARVLIRERHH